MAVPLITALTPSKYLKIVSRGAIYNNLSEDSQIWSKIKQKKAGPAEGREFRYNLRDSYGAAAVDFVPLTGGAYPSGDRCSMNEAVGVFKDYALTVELERTILNKAIGDFARYGEPLAEEMRCKTIALSRLLSIAAVADGTGVIGEVSSAAASSNDIVITLKSGATDLGFVGWFEAKDHYVAYSKAGAEVLPDSNASYAYLQLVSRNRATNQITVRAFTSAGVQINQATAANFIAGTVLYRKGRKTHGNIANISAIGSTEYNTLSEMFVGLDSMTANDGRVVNGITMSGFLAGQRYDAGGAAIDVQHFQRVLSNLMVACGSGRYKYKSAMLSWETFDALVESRESDRRFNTISDTDRGAAKLGYVHAKNTLAFEPDEFIPSQRIYVLPEGDSIIFLGRDFEFVNPNGSGQNFMLKPNSTGHDRVVRAYMEGEGSLYCVHPQALGCITNFTV